MQEMRGVADNDDDRSSARTFILTRVLPMRKVLDVAAIMESPRVGQEALLHQVSTACIFDAAFGRCHDRGFYPRCRFCKRQIDDKVVEVSPGRKYHEGCLKVYCTNKYIYCDNNVVRRVRQGHRRAVPPAPRIEQSHVCSLPRSDEGERDVETEKEETFELLVI